MARLFMTPGIPEIPITTTTASSRRRQASGLVEVLLRDQNIPSPDRQAIQDLHPLRNFPPPRVRPHGQCPPFLLHRELPIGAAAGDRGGGLRREAYFREPIELVVLLRSVMRVVVTACPG